MLAAVKRHYLRQEVEEILRRYIVDSQLENGDRLPPQRELAELLDVSRTVIREALTSMEGKGILGIRPGDGVVVRDSAKAAASSGFALADESDLPTKDLSEFVWCLYLGLAELMCARATAEDLERLDEMLDRMEARLREGRTVLREVEDFYWALAELSRNEIVQRLRPLWSEVDRRGLLAQASLLAKPTDKALGHLVHHRDIVAAIKSRDSQRLRAVFLVEAPISAFVSGQPSGGEGSTSVDGEI
jgi:DNA-binding FadR family transcriptional regulator